MAFSITWNSTFELGPAKTEKLGLAYQHINDVRKGTSERIRLEHEFDPAQNASQGVHRKGSARTFYQANAPTVGEQQALTSETSDLHIGRVWVGTDDILRVQTMANANIAGWKQLIGGGYALAAGSTVTWTTYSVTDADCSKIVLRKSGAATAANAVTSDGENLGTLEWWGNSASAFTLAAQMVVTQDGTAATNTPAKIAFVVADGTTTVTPLTLNKDGSVSFTAIAGDPNFLGTPTFADGLTVTAGGLTVTAGGLTVTAGGLTVTAGGLTVTAGGLTVTEGDVVVTDGSLTVTAGAFLPGTNDSGALGAAATSWSDLFLASGAVINWNNGDVTATHSANALAFAGASSGYSFDAALLPATDDAGALGSATLGWSDAFFASGAVLTWGAPSTPDATLTHSANMLTLAGADLTVPNLTLSGGTTGNVYSGAYTPDATGTDCTITANYSARYQRIGNIVFVDGGLKISTTSSSFGVALSLPIASFNQATLLRSGVAHAVGTGLTINSWCFTTGRYGTGFAITGYCGGSGTRTFEIGYVFSYAIAE
jgi:hypothetical protein